MLDEAIPRNSLIRVPYDNFKIYHPDGTLMCFCSKKKANWYLKNGLADLEEGTKIKLRFTPKGYGDPLAILVGRSNKCVITGGTNNLTKHHVVPTQFRQRFSSCYKDKNSCDLVVLCRDKHDEYEEVANEFKALLYEDYVDDAYRELHNSWCEAKSIFNCINNYYDKLPHDRQAYMTLRLKGLREKWKFTDKELKSRFLNGRNDHNRLIVERVGMVNMIVLWKLHFLKYGKPQFMPEWWKPNLVKVINKTDMQDRKTDLIEIKMDGSPELMNLIKKYDLYEIASLYL